MTLRQSVRKGDWVTASSTSGCLIVGQAAHDMSRVSSPSLEIVLGGDDAARHASRRITVTVNVNHWDVNATYHNLIEEGR